MQEYRRIKCFGESKFLKKPLIEVNGIESKNYKHIIKEVANAGIKVVTLREYDEKIVNFCNKNGIAVEDEEEYIPVFFESKIREHFKMGKSFRIGIIFQKEDRRIATKVILKICKYVNEMYIPQYSYCKNVAEKVMKENGLVVNLENSIEKIKKKSDSIIEI